MKTEIQTKLDEACARFEEFTGFTETPLKAKAVFMNSSQPKVAENPNEKIGIPAPVVPDTYITEDK